MPVRSRGEPGRADLRDDLPRLHALAAHAVARHDYNEAVARYSAYIRRFPQVLTAKLLGKGPRPYFELETPGAAKVPKVDFSK